MREPSVPFTKIYLCSDESKIRWATEKNQHICSLHVWTQSHCTCPAVEFKTALINNILMTSVQMTMCYVTETDTDLPLQALWKVLFTVWHLMLFFGKQYNCTFNRLYSVLWIILRRMWGAFGIWNVHGVHIAIWKHNNIPVCFSHSTQPQSHFTTNTSC